MAQSNTTRADIITLLFLFIAGIAGGILLGLVGVGMALIAVPVLTITLPLLGVPGPLAPVVALATSMGIVSIGSVSSIVAHNKLGNIDWSMFRRIVPFSIAGVLAGSVIVTWLPGAALRSIFAAFLVFVAYRMLTGRRAVGAEQPTGTGNMRAAGAAIGVAGALIGAGGGVFMVPYLAGRGWKMARAVATSTTIGLPVTLMGTLFHALHTQQGIDAPMLGSIHIWACIGLGLGSILGAPVGARLASRMPADVLKKGFALLLLILAAGLVLGV